MHSFLAPTPASATQINEAERAVLEARLISPAECYDKPAERWQQVQSLGLDTEFVRERTFFPRPGLIQISDGQTIWLLDPVGRDDFPCFGEILDNRNIIKILHSVGEDLEVFRILTGTLPDPLFDTQIAAAMLGLPLQFRYEKLVEHCFGVSLPGGQARSDWCRRPLGDTLLHYAAQDVIWLERLRETLTEALDRTGRLDWHLEDCARLIERARQPEQGPALMRVKGAGSLDDLALGWLERLADWREQEARKRDLPRGFVLRDEAMLELAGVAGQAQDVDQALRRLPPPAQRRHGEYLRELLCGPVPEPVARPPELIALDGDQKAAIKSAQAEVRRLAESMQLDPALIASKRELTRLVRGENPDWMDGWRGELLSDLAADLKP